MTDPYDGEIITLYHPAAVSVPPGDVTGPEFAALTDRVTTLEGARVDSIDDLSDVDLAGIAAGDRLVWDGTKLVKQTPAPTVVTFAVPLIIDGGGAVITAGPKGDIEIPFAATITRWRVLADVAGTISVELWRDSYANYPPTSADLLLTAAIISSANKSQSAALSTAVAADSVLRFVVTGTPTAITRCTVALTMTREIG